MTYSAWLLRTFTVAFARAAVVLTSEAISEPGWLLPRHG
jgi:hypothetical protein